MNPLYSIVIMVAFCIFIFFLLIIGYLLYINKFQKKYPPVLAECPDYWLDKSKGNISKCVNVENLGKAACPKIMDFSTSFWTGSDGLCNKYKWAKGCNLTWDGITTDIDACSDDNDS